MINVDFEEIHTNDTSGQTSILNNNFFVGAVLSSETLVGLRDNFACLHSNSSKDVSFSKHTEIQPSNIRLRFRCFKNSNPPMASKGNRDCFPAYTYYITPNGISVRQNVNNIII